MSNLLCSPTQYAMILTMFDLVFGELWYKEAGLGPMDREV